MNRIGLLLAELPPAYFALVMSTGIISIACHLLGLDWLSRPFFWLNLGFYLVLWSLTILRLVYYPRQILSDLKSPPGGWASSPRSPPSAYSEINWPS